jgi:hypothetical protein
MKIPLPLLQVIDGTLPYKALKFHSESNFLSSSIDISQITASNYNKISKTPIKFSNVHYESLERGLFLEKGFNFIGIFLSHFFDKTKPSSSGENGSMLDISPQRIKRKFVINPIKTFSSLSPSA